MIRPEELLSPPPSKVLPCSIAWTLRVGRLFHRKMPPPHRFISHLSSAHVFERRHRVRVMTFSTHDGGVGSDVAISSRAITGPPLSRLLVAFSCTDAPPSQSHSWLSPASHSASPPPFEPQAPMTNRAPIKRGNLSPRFLKPPRSHHTHHGTSCTPGELEMNGSMVQTQSLTTQSYRYFSVRWLKIVTSHSRICDKYRLMMWCVPRMSDDSATR